MRALTLTLLLLLPAIGGCRNSCQRVCVRMAKFAEQECGFTVTSDAISCCIEGQAGSGSSDDRATCRQFGGLSQIEDTWSCNDLEDYAPFDGSACN